MNIDAFTELLETQLRSLFLLIRNGKKPSDADRRYTEGLVHAAQALGALPTNDIQKLVERINHDVFGMSIAERQKRYPTNNMPIGNIADIPTFQRRGIRVE